MRTEPTITRICPVAVGGQGVVTLCHLHLDEADAERLAADGWVIHGLPGDRHLVCISKSPHPPTVPPGAREYAYEVRVRRLSWNRLRREHALLVRAKGLAVPRPYNIVEPDPSRPWEGEFFEEYIHGLTIVDAVARKLGPDPDQLSAFAGALFEILGGETGRTGLLSRDLVHRDVNPVQIIIPRSGGGLAWDRPVLLDLGVGYHPDEPLRDEAGTPYPTTEGLPRTTGWCPPERTHALYDKELGREERLHLDAAGDLWGWAMAVGYAATGENIWGVRDGPEGQRIGTDSWRQVMAGDVVSPPGIAAVADQDLAAALTAALHPDPNRRDRPTIASLLPRTLDQRAVEATSAVSSLRSELTIERQSLAATKAERDAAVTEREAANADRDAAVTEREAANADRDAALAKLAVERAASTAHELEAADLRSAYAALELENQQLRAAHQALQSDQKRQSDKQLQPSADIIPPTFSPAWMIPFVSQRNERARHHHDGVWRLEVEGLGSIRFKVQDGNLTRFYAVDVHGGALSPRPGLDSELLFFDANLHLGRDEFEAALHDPSHPQPKALAAFLNSPAS